MSPGGAITALVVSGPDDAWLLPDDPFLNAGCRVLRAGGLEEAGALCERHRPGLVFLPLGVAGASALPELKRCLTMKPAPVTVVVASNNQINAAAEAMRAGAFDCLFKPFSAARLAKTIESALKSLPRGQAPEPVLPVPPAQGGARGGRDLDGATTGGFGVIAASPEMRHVLTRITAVAPTPAPVFLSGEVGTGKSLLARLIHDRSDRASGPFVTFDCASLAPAHVGDAVLGPEAAARRAEGGTLFLDEICELAPEAQARLLRLIEASAPEPGGVPAARPVPFRLIAATRHDPRAAMREGRLRAELFYRLHVAPMHLPPLRARDRDVLLIARTRLLDIAAAENRQITGFTDAALDLLSAYDWPGNVRELLNVIWSAVLTSDGALLTPQSLPEALRTPPATPQPGRLSPAAAKSGAQIDLAAEALVGQPLAEIERAVIEATIRAEGGSVPRAARLLEVSPSTLYRKREAWQRSDPG